jgi:acyl carrier protein
LDSARSIIAEELGIEASMVTEETQLDSLPMDSLEFVEIILRIRNEIGDISESAIGDCITVGDLVRAVQ